MAPPFYSAVRRGSRSSASRPRRHPFGTRKSGRCQYFLFIGPYNNFKLKNLRQPWVFGILPHSNIKRARPVEFSSSITPSSLSFAGYKPNHFSTSPNNPNQCCHSSLEHIPHHPAVTLPEAAQPKQQCPLTSNTPLRRKPAGGGSWSQ